MQDEILDDIKKYRKLMSGLDIDSKMYHTYGEIVNELEEMAISVGLMRRQSISTPQQNVCLACEG